MTGQFKYINGCETGMFLEELSTKRERTRVFIRSHNVEGQIEVDQSLEKKKKIKK